MEWRDLLIDGYGRVAEELEQAVQKLSPEELEWQPGPGANSMGWLAWHLTRIQDDHVADLLYEEQLWTRDGWDERFGLPYEPYDTGFGHTPAQVAAFRSPGADVLTGYHRVAFERTKGYLASLSEADLGRELDEPWYQPIPTVGVRLVSVLSDCLQHVGQIAYVRGLLRGSSA
ncbi:MAG: mycothiol transferase [Chloroflexota bacterium]